MSLRTKFLEEVRKLSALVLAAIDSAGEKGVRQDRAANLVALAEERLRGQAPARPPVEVVVHVDVETLSWRTTHQLESGTTGAVAAGSPSLHAGLN